MTASRAFPHRDMRSRDYGSADLQDFRIPFPINYALAERRQCSRRTQPP